MMGKSIRVLVAVMMTVMIPVMSAFAADMHSDRRDMPEYRLSAYRDSIVNDNRVYTEPQARSLVRYLDGLRQVLPRDSMSLFASRALHNYSWFLIQNGEWYICPRLLKMAMMYCPPSDGRLLHQIYMAQGAIDLYCLSLKKVDS